MGLTLEIKAVYRELREHSLHDLAACLGDLNVGMGHSKRAGNCASGTEKFALEMGLEYERQYGKVYRRKYAPLSLIVSLMDRKQRFQYRLYLNLAIARAVIEAGRQDDLRALES